MQPITPSFESDLLRAISMLQELPLEVGEGFLSPLIKMYGWPFKSIQDSLHGTQWHRILYPLTLEQFSKLAWRRKNLLLNKDLLHPVSEDDIILLIRNKTEDVMASIGWDSEPSRRSMSWHRSMVLKTGSFCAPVTLALTKDGIKVLDGNHRIATLIDLGITNTVPIDAWIGFTVTKA